MQDLLKVIVIGVVVLTLLWLLRRNTTSTFTFQPFDGLKNPADVTASYRLQSQQIADELKAELLQAKADKKTKEELIAIADKFSDHSCAMGKAYSRWNINNVM
jgi:hypothetical protein